VSQQTSSTFVLVYPSEILAALVGRTDVPVLQYEQYERRGPHVELMVEQVPDLVRCPSCASVARVKERLVVHDIDLPSTDAHGTGLEKAPHVLCDRHVPEAELGPRNPPHRGKELRAHDQGGQVGHGPSRWGTHRLAGGRRAGL